MAIFMPSCLLVIDFGNYVVNFMAYSQLSASSWSTYIFNLLQIENIWEKCYLHELQTDISPYDSTNSQTTIFLACTLF